MPVRLILLITSVLSLGYMSALSQDLASIGKEKPIKISGGISANQIFYGSNLENARSPYNYYLGGQIALDIYGIQLPFAFTYSNQQSNFRQPFNQFSLHPSYKWLQGHFGYTSASYSPYTVNGHIMLGGALELKPGENWEIGLMTGRLQKAVLNDSTSDDRISAYRRFGYGFTFKYGSNSDYAQLIYFKSADDLYSLPAGLEDVLPEENLVASFSFSKLLFKKLIVQGEYSASALTRNMYSEASTEAAHPLAKLPWLLKPRTSTEYYNAYNARLAYQGNTYSVGVRYEQVGADYRTHGAYFFNNNFYSLTVEGNFSAYAKRVNLMLNLGLQEDDPQNLKMSRTSRLVGSVNLGIVPTDRLNISFNYSNFTTFTNINREFLDASFLTPFDQIDTLNYYQVAQNASVNTNYVISRGQNSNHSAVFNCNVMETKDFQAEMAQPTSSTFITANLGYQVSLTNKRLNLSAIVNMQKDTNPVSGTDVLGPTIALSKSYFERKMQSSFAFAYNRITGNGIQGNSMNARASASYRPADSHNFQASIIGIRRTRIQEINSVNQDFTFTVGYNYSF